MNGLHLQNRLKLGLSSGDASYGPYISVRVLIAALCVSLTMGEGDATKPGDAGHTLGVAGAMVVAASETVVQLNEMELTPRFKEGDPITLQSGHTVQLYITQQAQWTPEGFIYGSVLGADIEISAPDGTCCIADPSTRSEQIPIPTTARDASSVTRAAEGVLDRIREQEEAAERRRSDQSGTLSGLAAAMRRMEEAAQVTEDTNDDTFDDYDGPGEILGPDCSLVENSSIC
ncbi:hypothetical protein [Pseudooceanicola sp.]|uniref:hypothetical protein n=1 Tax=Pseudooceanicola sp. TaxID=1914328 RepID=UPI0026222CC6|nr:hypothetical protein [Pseudooceanicola sp.]MDF1854298.1 hypothetical protein [Pseudooceanicola sp.]